MVMHGKNDFLDVLLGNAMTPEGEVNSVIPQQREFDQELDPLDILAMDPTITDSMTQYLGEPSDNLECMDGVPKVADFQESAPSTSGSTTIDLVQLQTIVGEGLADPNQLVQICSLDESMYVEPENQNIFVFESEDNNGLHVETEITIDTDCSLSNSDSISNLSSPPATSVFSPTGSVFSPTTPSTSESLLPTIVREGLKYTIQTRRQKEGKGMLEVEFKDPEPETLTEEEQEKRQQRRAKNKLAAQKCRSKKRERADTLELETEKLRNKQSKLKLEIQKLMEERDHLMDIVQVHKSVCPKMRCHSSSW